jgi:hypothetical protein
MQQIGRYLDNVSLANLARSCKTTSYRLDFDLAWRRASCFARTARDIEAFQSAMQAADAFDGPRQAFLYRMLAWCTLNMPDRALVQEAARVLTERANTQLCATGRACMSIALLGVFGHRGAKPPNDLLQRHEHDLHGHMMDESLPERGALMAGYLSVIRELPPAQRDPAYWVRTVSTFTPSQAAATLVAASRWMFPPRDNAKCEQAFSALLGVARSLRDSDGRALAEQAPLLAKLIDIVSGYSPGRGPDPRGCWHMLCDAALALPAGVREPLLRKLADAGLNHCSVDRLTMQGQWDRLLAAAPGLSPTGRTVLLCTLVSAFGFNAWCVAGDDDSDSDTDGSDADDSESISFQYGPDSSPNLTTVQEHHPAAQHAIAERAARLLDTAVGLPTAEREQVLGAVARMLAEREPYWETAPLGRIRLRLDALM